MIVNKYSEEEIKMRVELENMRKLFEWWADTEIMISSLLAKHKDLTEIVRELDRNIDKTLSELEKLGEPGTKILKIVINYFRRYPLPENVDKKKKKKSGI